MKASNDKLVLGFRYATFIIAPILLICLVLKPIFLTKHPIIIVAGAILFLIIGLIGFLQPLNFEREVEDENK